MRATPGIVGWNSGEWGPSMESRSDVKGYATAAFAMENFLPQVAGPVRRRPGSRFLSEVLNSANRTAITEFIKSTTSAFVLEWDDKMLRFYNQNHELVTVLAPSPGGFNTLHGGVTVDGTCFWINIGLPPWFSNNNYQTASSLYIIDSNGNIQQLLNETNTNFSGMFQPIWETTIGAITYDNQLQWQCVGKPAWAPLTAYGANAIVLSSIGIQIMVGNPAGNPGVSGPGAQIPYMIPTPYAATDLFDANGFLQLVFTQSADVIYVTHRSTTFPVYKLSHFADANWTLTAVAFVGGPFGDQNAQTNPVVFSSGQTGEVTLTASADIFDPLLMGSYMQLMQQNLSEIRQWQAGKNYLKGARVTAPNGATYECVGGAGSSPFMSGGTPPTHTSGQQYDGADAQGIIWLYRDGGYGLVQLLARGGAPVGISNLITGITAAKPPVVTVMNAPAFANGDLVFITGVVGMSEVNDDFYRVAGLSGNTFHLQQDTKSGTGAPADVDGTSWGAYVLGGSVDNRLYTCTAMVLTQAQDGSSNRLPASVEGSENATSLYAFAAWNNRDGYPTSCAFFRGRLAFGRAGRIDISVANDFENFSALDLTGQATPDLAIAITLPIQDPINWLVSGRILVGGTDSSEQGIGEINQSAALSTSNIKTQTELLEGSRAVKPTVVGLSLLWVQTSGINLRAMKYQFYTDNYLSDDLSSTNDSIMIPGVVGLAFQKVPDRVVWMIRSDGLLIGFTFNEEQQVLAWHRHPMVNGTVESICSIPAADGTMDELWMVVNRTINGVAKRYVEVLAPHFLAGDSVVTDAFYLDASTTYSGAPTTTITGLAYLEGQTVRVLADGSAHPDCIVMGGAIQLARTASVVQVGLKYRSKLTTMPLEFQSGTGTAIAKTKRVSGIIVRFLNTLGGELGSDDPAAQFNYETVENRDPADKMDQPPPLINGFFPGGLYQLNWPEGYEQNAKLTYRNDTPFPATVVGMYPDVNSAD